MYPTREGASGHTEILCRLDAWVLSRVWLEGQGALLRLEAASQPAAPGSMERLRHEYSLAGHLNAAWSAKPRALEVEHDRAALLLDAPEGELLGRLMGQPWEMASFLRVAHGIAVALAQVHAQGLIHRDVKPDHLFVDVAGGRAWLTGFGIASRLAREHQAPDLPETIAGTLAYMAPEQTGRMNRSVDARSDLYALGVTLYQMLTGELPFAATEAMELVHCHIAVQAVPPAVRVAGVPAPVSGLVMKLLAKTAEERYQSAAGVAADLERCATEHAVTGRIEPFALGDQDVSDVLRIPEKLYGREGEIGRLLAAFERVVSAGAPELVLVSGYSGIGKSSVVHELHKAIVPPRGLFAAGKFDQYERDVPYATLAQAFRMLVRQILMKSEAEVGRWRGALRDALGASGALMVAVIPELEVIIGKQPAVAELPPQEAQARFQHAFRGLIGAFARPQHPLVIFLDDLQWLDAATLSLLVHLLTHSEVRHLLLVGAYRDNEVDASHPLVRSLDTIRGAGARVEQISLGPLAPDDIDALVADSLHVERVSARPLSQLIFEKTGGNPFFTLQFLGALADEALIAFDHGARAWAWDLERIRAKGYTDNVGDLMAAKLGRLSPATRDVLAELACLGNVIEIDLLASVQAAAEEGVEAALWEAVRAGLLLRGKDHYSFLHDRVQEAAYSLIPSERRAEVHLRLGRRLLASMAPGEMGESIFDVVKQFNAGAALALEPGERERVAELNLRAGRKARAAAAYASACTYFAAGMTLLGDGAWATHYALAFALHLERARCEFLTGNSDFAEELIAQLLVRAVSNIDRAAAYQIKIDLRVARSQFAQAVDATLDCLRMFGIDMPKHPTREQVEVEYQKVWRRFGDRPIESLIDLPPMTNPEMQAAMRVLAALVGPAYSTDINLVYLHLCHMVNTSLEFGTSEASPHGYSWFGIILGPVFGRYDESRRFGKVAWALAEKHHAVPYKAKIHYSSGLLAVWTEPISTAVEYMRLAHGIAVQTGNLTIGCYSAEQLVFHLLIRGDPLDSVWREAERGLEYARRTRFRDVEDIFIGQQRFIENMRGRTSSFSSLSDARFDEAEYEARLTAERMPAMVCWYWITKLAARFLSGDYDAARDASAKAKAAVWSMAAHASILDYHYYAALLVAATWEDLSPQQREGARAELAAHLAQLAEWAGKGSATFRDKHALVAAEVARIEGRMLDAQQLYEDAIRLAHENGFVQNEALCNELASRLYEARGYRTIAAAYRRNARACYVRWGAEGKVRQLEQDFPDLREETAPPRATSTTSSLSERLDLATVVKVSQAVAGEIVLERLVDTLMVSALEQAGASRGLLILPHGDVLRIEAEAEARSDRIEVRLLSSAVTATDLPESVLRYVTRTRDGVLLDDVALPNAYSGDPYFQRNRARSMLCLPLLKQARLIGVLYLENALAPKVFTPARAAVLKLLASQAATSLENARLFDDLKRSEERYALAVDAAGDGHTDWIVATDEFYASPRLLEMCGLPPDTRFAGREDWIRRFPLHPVDRERVMRTLSEAQHEWPGPRLELAARILRNGETRSVLMTVRYSRDAEGRLLRASSAITDVTERVRAEEALRASEKRLRQAQRLEALGTFAGGIAHDFNNILGAILGYSEMAMRDAHEGTRLRRDLDSILVAGERGRALVDRILAFSNTVVRERVPVHVEAVVRETLRLIAGKLPEGVRIDEDLRSGGAAARGDPTQLHQVLMNLATNAVHAMPSGGVLRVALEVERVDESRSRLVGSVEAGEYIKLTVSDTGTGIAPDVLERMFDPFFTTKGVGVGTGLGLSLVHSIVTDMGGAIDVASRSGEGSTFTVYMPRSGDLSVATDEDLPSVPRGAGQRVLVVDDEEPLARLAERSLGELGYVPLVFTSATAALDAFRADPQRFEAMLVDERMPGMTGCALIREVRSLRGGIPAVLMTGFVGGGLLARARDAGADVVLKKPLLTRDLANGLARALQAQ